MRRVFVASAILLVAAGCSGAGADGDSASKDGPQLQKSATAEVRITYGDADGQPLWTIAQNQNGELAYITPSDKVIVFESATYVCTGLDGDNPSCEEVSPDQVEYAPFGPQTIVGLTTRFADEPTLLEGRPTERTIAERGALCYKLDADTLLDGTVDDPKARGCFDKASGWILEFVAADADGGIAFTALAFEPPNETDFLLRGVVSATP